MGGELVVDLVLDGILSQIGLEALFKTLPGTPTIVDWPLPRLSLQIIYHVESGIPSHEKQPSSTLSGSFDYAMEHVLSLF